MTKAPKKKTRVRPRKPKPADAPRDLWDLRLYVVGQTAKSVAAIENLKRLCETHLEGKYHIEVIDLRKHPHLAKVEQIVAIPTLVRKLPGSMMKIVGDLSDTEQVLLWVGICNRTVKHPPDGQE